MIELRKFFELILSTFRSRTAFICHSSCDGFIVRLHYRWTFIMLIALHFITWYNWYFQAPIICVSHFNADKQVRLDYLNICFSYVYIKNDGKKRYLLFYRWIPFTLALLALLYYIPRKVSKNFDNNRCRSLLQDLASNEFRYDPSEKALVDRTIQYMMFNLKTHDALYWKFLTVNGVALFIDLLTLNILDFILQGRFLKYGLEAFPFHRDPRYFKDYMSLTFPPFASCNISEANKLTNSRTEILGCHLTLMELYEKCFFILWLWLIFLCLVTTCYIIFLLAMLVPKFDSFLLRAAKPAHAIDNVSNIVQNVIQNCKIGDIYLLYRFKSHLSHSRFYELMTCLSDPRLSKKLIIPTAAPLDDMQRINDLKKLNSHMQNNMMLHPPNGMIPYYQNHM